MASVTPIKLPTKTVDELIGGPAADPVDSIPVYIQVTSVNYANDDAADETNTMALVDSAALWIESLIEITKSSANEETMALLQDTINDFDGKDQGLSWLMPASDIYSFPARCTLKLKSLGVAMTGGVTKGSNGATLSVTLTPLVPLNDMIGFYEFANYRAATLPVVQKFIAVNAGDEVSDKLDGNPWLRVVGLPGVEAGVYTDVNAMKSYANFAKAMASMQMLFSGSGLPLTGLPAGDKTILYPTSIAGDTSQTLGSSAITREGDPLYVPKALSSGLELTCTGSSFTATWAHYTTKWSDSIMTPATSKLMNVQNLFFVQPIGSKKQYILSVASYRQAVHDAWSIISKTAASGVATDNRPCLPYVPDMENLTASFAVTTLSGDKLIQFTDVKSTKDSRLVGGINEDVVTGFTGTFSDQTELYTRLGMQLIQHSTGSKTDASLDTYLNSPSKARYAIAFAAALVRTGINFWPLTTSAMKGAFPATAYCKSQSEAILAGANVLEISPAEALGTINIRQIPIADVTGGTKTSGTSVAVAGMLGNLCDQSMSARVAEVINMVYNGNGETEDALINGIKTLHKKFSVMSHGQGARRDVTITIPKPTKATNVNVQLSFTHPLGVVEHYWSQAIKFQLAYDRIDGQDMLYSAVFANKLADALYGYVQLGLYSHVAYGRNTAANRYIGCIAGTPNATPNGGEPIEELPNSKSVDYVAASGGVEATVIQNILTDNDTIQVNFKPKTMSAVTSNTVSSDVNGIQNFLDDLFVPGPCFYGLAVAGSAVATQVFPADSAASGIVPTSADGIAKIKSIVLSWDMLDNTLDGKVTLSFDDGVKFSLTDISSGFMGNIKKGVHIAMQELNWETRPPTEASFDPAIRYFQRVPYFPEGQQGLLTAVELAMETGMQKEMLNGKDGAIFEKSIKKTYDPQMITTHGYIVQVAEDNVKLVYGSINGITQVTQADAAVTATVQDKLRRTTWRTIISRDPDLTALFVTPAMTDIDVIREDVNKVFNDWIQQAMLVEGSQAPAHVGSPARATIEGRQSIMNIAIRSGFYVSYNTNATAERLQECSAAALQWRYLEYNSSKIPKPASIPMFEYLPTPAKTYESTFNALAAPLQLAAMPLVSTDLLAENVPYTNEMLVPGVKMDDTKAPTPTVVVSTELEGSVYKAVVKRGTSAQDVPAAAKIATWQYAEYYTLAHGVPATLDKLKDGLKEIGKDSNLSKALGSISWYIMRTPITIVEQDIRKIDWLHSPFSPLNASPACHGMIQFVGDTLTYEYGITRNVDIAKLAFSFVNNLNEADLNTYFSTISDRRAISEVITAGLYSTAMIAGQAYMYRTQQDVFVLPAMLGEPIATQRAKDVPAGSMGLVVKKPTSVAHVASEVVVKMKYEELPVGAKTSGSGDAGKSIYGAMLQDVLMPVSEKPGVDTDGASLPRGRVMTNSQLQAAFTSFMEHAAALTTDHWHNVQDTEAYVQVLDSNKRATTAFDGILVLEYEGGMFLAAIKEIHNDDAVGLSKAIYAQALEKEADFTNTLFLDQAKLVALSMYHYSIAVQTSLTSFFNDKTWYALPAEMGASFARTEATQSFDATAQSGVSKIKSTPVFSSSANAVGLKESTVTFEPITSATTLKGTDYGSFDMRAVASSGATSSGTYTLYTPNGEVSVKAQTLINELYGTGRSLPVEYVVIPQMFGAEELSNVYRYRGKVDFSFNGISTPPKTSVTLKDAYNLGEALYYPLLDRVARDLCSAIRADSGDLADADMAAPANLQIVYYTLYVASRSFNYSTTENDFTKPQRIDVGLMEIYSSSPVGKTTKYDYDASKYENALVISAARVTVGTQHLTGVFNPTLSDSVVAVEKSDRQIFMGVNMGFPKGMKEPMWNQFKRILQIMRTNEGVSKDFTGTQYEAPNISDNEADNMPGLAYSYSPSKGMVVTVAGGTLPPGPPSSAGTTGASMFWTSLVASITMLLVLVS
eukprot:GHVQ01009202.1.p1 GENE.GHVQ01009202.1~~GHVQ01009202.1.p1  ORF type:complete len:2155 (-),score=290.98 GHVQ01009202.1:45-5927(-)